MWLGWRAGVHPHRFPHDNFSSVYRIFTKLGHMIPLWKGKNPIYFGVMIRSKVKVTITIKYNFWQQGRFRTITLVLYIGSLPNLATWFPCGRGRTLFILGSLPLFRLIIYIDGRILWCTHFLFVCGLYCSSDFDEGFFFCNDVLLGKSLSEKCIALFCNYCCFSLKKGQTEGNIKILTYFWRPKGANKNGQSETLATLDTQDEDKTNKTQKHNTEKTKKDEQHGANQKWGVNPGAHER